MIRLHAGPENLARVLNSIPCILHQGSCRLMIEFTAQSARLPAAAPGRSQTAAPTAEKPGFAAVLADAAEPEPNVDAPAEPSPAPPSKVTLPPSTRAELPVSGKILPDAPLVLEEAATSDTVLAPLPKNSARTALLTRTLTLDDGAAEKPALPSDAAEQEHDARAPDETPPMAVVLQLLNVLDRKSVV